MYPDAKPNVFYDASAVTDFPIRDRAVVLHVLIKKRDYRGTNQEQTFRVETRQNSSKIVFSAY